MCELALQFNLIVEMRKCFRRVEQLNSDLQSVQRAYRNYQRRISDAVSGREIVLVHTKGRDVILTSCCLAYPVKFLLRRPIFLKMIIGRALVNGCGLHG